MRNIKLNIIDDSFFNDKKKIISLIQAKKFDKANEFIKLNTNNELKIIEENKVKNELLSNQHYILNSYWQFFKKFISFWEHMESSPDTSWNYLQDCFIIIDVLDLSTNGNNLFDSDILYNYLRKIESMFPYTMFNSVEYITKKATCSICGNDPFSSQCTHIKGDLHSGERCYVTIEDADLMGTSFVKNPANKKCVIVVNYDKNNVKYSSFGKIWQLSFKKPLYDFKIVKKTRIMSRNEYLKYLKNIEKNPILPNKRIFKVEYKEVTQLQNLFS